LGEFRSKKLFRNASKFLRSVETKSILLILLTRTV
jgi:hypothetical protein